MEAGSESASGTSAPTFLLLTGGEGWKGGGKKRNDSRSTIRFGVFLVPFCRALKLSAEKRGGREKK